MLIRNEEILGIIAANPNKPLYFKRDMTTGLSEVFPTRQKLFETLDFSDATFNKLIQRPWAYFKNMQLYSSKNYMYLSRNPIPYSRKLFMKDYAFSTKTLNDERVLYGEDGVKELSSFLHLYDPASASRKSIYFRLITKSNAKELGADPQKLVNLRLASFANQDDEYEARSKVAKNDPYPELINQETTEPV